MSFASRRAGDEAGSLCEPLRENDRFLDRFQSNRTGHCWRRDRRSGSGVKNALLGEGKRSQEMKSEFKPGGTRNKKLRTGLLASLLGAPKGVVCLVRQWVDVTGTPRVPAPPPDGVCTPDPTPRPAPNQLLHPDTPYLDLPTTCPSFCLLSLV